MSPTASNDRRWAVAQQAEREYWDITLARPQEFLRILADKYGFLEHIQQHAPSALQLPEQANILEIGIGPLGIGVCSLLAVNRKAERVGIDPLPRATVTRLPDPLQRCLEAFAQQPLRYVQQPAEQYEPEANRYDLVISFNVLDHTQEPALIVAKAFTALRPGGYFLLNVDVQSLYNRLRKAVFRKKHFDAAHPHRFDVRGIIRLFRGAGYEIVWCTPKELRLRRYFFGRGKRPFHLVARKP